MYILSIIPILFLCIKLYINLIDKLCKTYFHVGDFYAYFGGKKLRQINKSIWNSITFLHTTAGDILTHVTKLFIKIKPL